MITLAIPGKIRHHQSRFWTAPAKRSDDGAFHGGVILGSIEVSCLANFREAEQEKRYGAALPTALRKNAALSPQAKLPVAYCRRVKDANTIATANLGLPVGSDRLLYGDWGTRPIVKS